MGIEDEIQIHGSVRGGRVANRPKRMPKRMGKPYSIRFLIALSTLFVFLLCASPSLFLFFLPIPIHPGLYTNGDILGIVVLVLAVIFSAVYHVLASWFYDDLQEHYIKIQNEAMTRALNRSE